MNIKIYLSALTIVAAGFLFTACEGDVGPQGSKGDTGTTGTTGTKGDKGDSGDPGQKGANNGNIIVREGGPGAIAAGTNGAGYNWSYGPTTGVTADIVEASAVFVYLQNSLGDWYLLPGSVWSGTNYQTFALRVTVEENRALSRVRITRTEGEGTLDFKAARIILVPNTVAARQSAVVDYTDYEAVKKYYNLAD